MANCMPRRLRRTNNVPIHAADEPVAQAGHKGEGHRVCKVGADDADRRQPRIEKEEHGHTQGAGTYRAQRHEHAEHRTEDHGDPARVARSRRVVSAGQGVIAAYSAFASWT